MKIYFSPVYTSRVHISQPLMMDSTVCNVPQLVNLIELHTGIHHKEYSRSELCVHYLQALLQMDKANVGNLLHESLIKDPLSTAKACLDWRDKLVLAGWTAEMRPTPRIEALALAEQYFEICTMADRIVALPGLIAKSGIAKKLEVEVQYDENLMHPAVTAIIDSLRENGAVVTYPAGDCCPEGCNLRSISDWMSGIAPAPEIKRVDDSVEIIQFRDRKDILRHITSMTDEAVCHSLWISDHAADIDRALSRGGKNTTGSATDSSLPAIVQLLPLGMSMYRSPADINQLVAWLRAPRSPLPGVRFSIANVILKSGGWNQDEIDEAIEKYIKNHPEIYEKTVKTALKKYLRIPAIDEKTNVKLLGTFIKNLKEWAVDARRQEYQMEYYCQFDRLIERLSSMQVLLDFHEGDTIDSDILSQWCNMACEVDSYEQYSAHCQAPMLISCPADMLGIQDCCHWMGFSNFAPAPKSYAFLSAIERKRLTESGCRLYAEDKEIEANRIVNLWPLRHVRHLIIYEMKDKDPNEIRSVVSQQLLSLPKESRDVITRCAPEAVCEEASCTIEHFGAPESLTIKVECGESLPFLPVESYSSIDMLIQYPLEYVLKYSLGLKPATDDTIKVSTSTGNVVHQVIERLFTPGRKVARIREHYNSDYEALLDQAINEKGMILLLPENKIELIKLRNNLRKSIENLIDIYEANGFVTVACEEEIKDGINLPDGHGMRCFLDMHVVDESGGLVIIDLKWTSSHKYYEDKVKEEKALQLDIYHSMLSSVHRNVKSAFYVMPRNRMYTYYDMKGYAVEHIAIEHIVDDMIERLINSYLYRRSQIERGEIEMADGAKFDDFDYGRDLKDKSRTDKLYPLESDKSTKNANRFSDYKCFY